MVDKLNKPLALVASDLHLQDRTWKHRNVTGDSYRSWSQIVDAAIAKEVNVVILAGDLLDRQINDSDPITQLAAGFSKLEQHGIKVLFIQGQHELQDKPWACLSMNTHHLHRNGFYPLNEKFVVAGIDYQHREHLEDELSFLCETSTYEPEKTVLVMHQVWRDWMGDRALPQGRFEQVDNWFPGLGLLITGDLHEQRIESYGSIRQILSPGSTCMQNITEPEDKYIYFLQEGEDGNLQIVPERLETRAVFRYEIFTEQDRDLLPEAIQAFWDSSFSCKPLAHVKYSAEVVKPSFIEECCKDLHLFLKEVHPYSQDDSVESVSEAYKDGIVFTLKSLLAEEENSEVKELAERLLSAGDPEKTLLDWYAERTLKCT